MAAADISDEVLSHAWTKEIEKVYDVSGKRLYELRLERKVSSRVRPGRRPVSASLNMTRKGLKDHVSKGDISERTERKYISKGVDESANRHRNAFLGALLKASWRRQGAAVVAFLFIE